MNVMKADPGRKLIPIGAAVVAAACVAWAAYLRFATGYFYLHRFAMGLACVFLAAFACVSLAGWIWGKGEHRRRRLAAAGIYAAALGLIALMGHESTAANLRKNRAYLERLAGVAAEYVDRHGEAPDGFDQALRDAHLRSGLVLPNRGDADGRSLAYAKLGKRSFALTSRCTGIKVVYRDGAVSAGGGAPTP